MIADSGQPTGTEILQRMQQETERYNWASLSKLAEEYAMRLRASAAAPQLEIPRVLDLLRRCRQYDALMSVADAALANEPAAPGIWRRYAQALIDSGRRPRRCGSLPTFSTTRPRPSTSGSRPAAARAASSCTSPRPRLGGALTTCAGPRMTTSTYTTRIVKAFGTESTPPHCSLARSVSGSRCPKPPTPVRGHASWQRKCWPRWRAQ
jgi:hypothetical protein